MCRSKFVLLFVAFVLLFNSLVFADGGILFDEEPSIPAVVGNPASGLSSECFVLMDALTGQILSEKSAHVKRPIASTTKIITALVALENSSLDEVVTADEECVGIEGSSIYLYKGEKLTMNDLLYALMLESANDAAVCIARHVAGSEEEFVRMMNEKAAQIGMTNSHFVNPHGLHDDDHYSTAYDMALLLKAAMENEHFEKIISTKTYKIPLNNTDGYRFLSNHNRLLKTYEDCIGGKTGYTKTAGRCLATVARRDGATLIMVTLNAPNDWADHKNMFEYGFSLYSKISLATPGSISYTLPVVSGKKSTVKVENIIGLDMLLRDQSKIETVVELPQFLYAPIDAVELPYDEISYKTVTPVGKAIFYYDGVMVGQVELYATEAVEAEEIKSFWQKLWDFFF